MSCSSFVSGVRGGVRRRSCDVGFEVSVGVVVGEFAIFGRFSCGMLVVNRIFEVLLSERARPLCLRVLRYSYSYRFR